MHDVNGSLHGQRRARRRGLADSTTEWTRYLLRRGRDGSSTGESRSEGESPDPYVAGSKRAGAWVFFADERRDELTTANLPDEVRYQTDAVRGKTTAIAGPINVTLSPRRLGVDTEFYVELNDVDRTAT